MKSTTKLSFVLAASMAAAVSANAAEWDTGPYAGIGFGVSGFDLDATATPGLGQDLRGSALKLYGGYQLTRYVGVEAGYARTGQLNETRLVDGQPVTQAARSRMLFVAATGRIPVKEKFMVTGRVGRSYGDVNGSETISGADSVFGRKTSWMGGFGAQYQVNEQMILALDIENIGKESSRVSAGMVTLSMRRSF